MVDIAETCEELFPFDEVATRHSVPRHKVAEAFAAIIQLPLLRCATDKRRHGKLASARMKEYTKARKELQHTASSSGTVGSGSEGGNSNAPSFSPAGMVQAVAPGASSDGGSRMLPGVMELAQVMSPVEYTGPDFYDRGFMGPW
ncbi:hypothetical protein NKR23_g9822 [Pleurostoma richardsiae]|jgi:hypothetical protein|uniref:Uncharacterized protein n=1 Tax=Pleurostoma richardsiae TaxID=41990 RepID=A0AA38VEM4_9PEZI|nr:hypothetical protein NKR23_g9822 [Pleurostoma richardsiae]